MRLFCSSVYLLSGWLLPPLLFTDEIDPLPQLAQKYKLQLGARAILPALIVEPHCHPITRHMAQQQSE